jgi:hypothetical protein
MLTILVSITLGVLCHFYLSHKRNRQIRPAFKKNGKTKQRDRKSDSESNKSDVESVSDKVVNYTEAVYDLNGRKNYVQKQKRVRETSNQNLSVIDEFSPVQSNQMKNIKINPAYANFKRREQPVQRLPIKMQMHMTDYESENPRQSVLQSFRNVFGNKNKNNDIDVAKQIRRPSPEQY